MKVFRSVVKHIATGAEGLWFDSGDGQIKRSVANGWPPMRRFFRTVSPRPLVAEVSPVTLHTLQRNIACV